MSSGYELRDNLAISKTLHPHSKKLLIVPCDEFAPYLIRLAPLQRNIPRIFWSDLEFHGAQTTRARHGLKPKTALHHVSQQIPPMLDHINALVRGILKPFFDDTPGSSVKDAPFIHDVKETQRASQGYSDEFVSVEILEFSVVFQHFEDATPALP